MRRMIFALLIVATAAQADHEHSYTKSKTETKTCCLSGESEPNCTGKQIATYLLCSCGAKRAQDSTACQ